jgi:hypothetical protein
MSRSWMRAGRPSPLCGAARSEGSGSSPPAGRARSSTHNCPAAPHHAGGWLTDTCACGAFTGGSRYRRDTSLAGEGFLSEEQADALWSSQSEMCAQYLMEVGLDCQWYRDEVSAGGALRHITYISRYTDFGQQMEWDEAAEAMVLVRGQRNIYIPILEQAANPAAFANDACFGVVDPGEEPDRYDALSSGANALEQVPCLSRGPEGKLWWSSVWLYPRLDWAWPEAGEEAVEVTFAYGWPLEGWMLGGGGGGGGGGGVERVHEDAAS